MLSYKNAAIKNLLLVVLFGSLFILQQTYWNAIINIIFWVLVIPIIWITSQPFNLFVRTLTITGALLNAVAITANGGRMPVAHEFIDPKFLLWQPMTSSTRLPFLCDIFHGVSVGDMLILTGLVIGIIIYLKRL